MCEAICAAICTGLIVTPVAQSSRPFARLNPETTSSGDHFHTAFGERLSAFNQPRESDPGPVLPTGILQREKYPCRVSDLWLRRPALYDVGMQTQMCSSAECLGRLTESPRSAQAGKGSDVARTNLEPTYYKGHAGPVQSKRSQPNVAAT